MAERFSFDVDGERLTAFVYTAARKPLGSTLLLAHGASAGQRSTFIVDYATGLAERGVLVITYDFPFAQHGQRSPNSNEALRACCRAAIVAARQCRPRNRLFIGGKSLGGRISTEVAAEGGEEVDDLAGIVVLGYPLHPVGRPAALRSHHLRDLRLPVMFVQGTRDVFGAPDELRQVLPRARGSEIHVVDGGDHSFSVPKRSPLTQAEVHEGIKDAIALWMSAIGSGRGATSPLPKVRPIPSRVRSQLRALRRGPGSS